MAKKDLQAQIHSLEQLLVIREKEIDELKKRVDELIAIQLLQRDVNEAQKGLNIAIRQELEGMRSALMVTMSLVQKLTEEGPVPPPKDTGVSEVG